MFCRPNVILKRETHFPLNSCKFASMILQLVWTCVYCIYLEYPGFILEAYGKSCRDGYTQVVDEANCKVEKTGFGNSNSSPKCLHKQPSLTNQRAGGIGCVLISGYMVMNSCEDGGPITSWVQLVCEPTGMLFLL